MDISRIWLNPKMAFRGVLNSWLIRDRNWVLASLADSADSLAARSISSDCFLAAMLLSVMTIPLSSGKWDIFDAVASYHE